MDPVTILLKMVAGAALGIGGIVIAEVLELPPRYAVMVGMMTVFIATLIDS